MHYIDIAAIVACWILFGISIIWIIRNAIKDSPLSGYFMPIMGFVVSLIGLAILN